MSLLDTIKGARQEAEEAGTLIGGQKKGDEKAVADTTDADKAKSGYARRSSAASAKPTRELAGSVHTAAAKPKSEMTKEEKRAARDKRREEEDVIYDAKKAMLESMPEYKRTQRVWWALLIAGILCTLLSWGIIRTVNSNTADSDGVAMISVVLMVLAYVLVIGAFIYDLVRVRPLRRKADEKLVGMSKRRLRKFVSEEEERKAAEKAKK